MHALEIPHRIFMYQLPPTQRDTLQVLWFTNYLNDLYLVIIEASLSKPHIDHDNSPAHGIMVSLNVSIHVCIIYPTFVAPWFLRSMYALKCVFWYIDVLTCVICMHSAESCLP